jgi:hypothetical protein
MSSTLIYPQGIFRRHEIPVAEYLMSHKQALIDEFIAGYADLSDVTQDKRIQNMLGDRPVNELEMLETKVGDQIVHDVDSWKTFPFKYEHKDANIYVETDEQSASKYPTAYKLVKGFGANCPIAGYSCFAPQTALHRHTGVENRYGQYIRIHIPLIIPEGDVFFECNGEEITWSDIFGFNNQLVHSAYNYSDEYRLVFILDLDRVSIGMPPGESYNRELELNPKPFIRNK